MPKGGIWNAPFGKRIRGIRTNPVKGRRAFRIDKRRRDVIQ